MGAWSPGLDLGSRPRLFCILIRQEEEDETDYWTSRQLRGGCVLQGIRCTGGQPSRHTWRSPRTRNDAGLYLYERLFEPKKQTGNHFPLVWRTNGRHRG
jgi:hypothetical protein